MKVRAEKVIRDTFPGFDESNVSRVVCRVTQALTALVCMRQSFVVPCSTTEQFLSKTLRYRHC